MSKTQDQIVLDWLKSGKTLTALEALYRWGIGRLSARIYTLKKLGHKIKSVLIWVRNRFGDLCHVASYKLIK